MAITLRLTESEQAALKARAEAEGMSMQEAVQQAVREFVGDRAHRERVTIAAERVTRDHAAALRRLGD